MEGSDSKDLIILRSSDGFEHKVDVKVAKMSATLKTMLEG